MAWCSSRIIRSSYLRRKRCAAPRAISRNAFQRMARFESRSNQIQGDRAVPPASPKLPPQPLCTKVPPPRATKQQLFCFETLNRLAQGGTGDVELFCQFTRSGGSFSPGTHWRLKTPAAARSHRRVLLADFAAGHDFCLGPFARSQLVFTTFMCL